MADGGGLTLLVRAYCHLCDDMRAAVAPLASARGLALREIDVDADPGLESRWGERVPVLLFEGREICHYHFDRTAFERLLPQPVPAVMAAASDFS